MKISITIAVMAVLTLTFGIAYADQLSNPSRDLGTELYISAFPIHDTAIEARDFGVTGKRFSGELVDIGTALYEDFLMKEEMVARSEAVGSAAGGVAKEDENSRIWDDLLKPTGGTEEAP